MHTQYGCGRKSFLVTIFTFSNIAVSVHTKAHLLLLIAMKNIPFRSPPTLCAFHQTNPISHFCRYSQCLLPLCRECLSIHRKQHSTKQSPIDLIPIQEQGFSVFRSISQQVLTLDQAYTEIVDSVNSSNQLHGQLKNAIFAEKEALLQAISLYYDSLLREVDLNFQRRHKWLQDISNLYHSVRQEMVTIQQRLQGEKHLRTIIMWNRLRPEDSISDLLRQAKRHLEPPSYVPCDIQKIISIMSQSQSMVVLDLQGDMGFSHLAKLLYTLRFGPQQSSVSSTLSPTKPAGISLISRGSIVKSSTTPSQRLILSKSADRL